MFEAVKDAYVPVRKISTGHVNHGCIIYRVPSISQRDSLKLSTFSAYFTKHYVASD